jgi:hypothetical protein
MILRNLPVENTHSLPNSPNIKINGKGNPNNLKYKIPKLLKQLGYPS